MSVTSAAMFSSASKAASSSVYSTHWMFRGDCSVSFNSASAALGLPLAFLNFLPLRFFLAGGGAAASVGAAVGGASSDIF